MLYCLQVKRNRKLFCCHSEIISDILAFLQTSYILKKISWRAEFPLRWTFHLLLTSPFLCSPFFLPSINYFTLQALQSIPIYPLSHMRYGDVDSSFAVNSNVYLCQSVFSNDHLQGFLLCCPVCSEEVAVPTLKFSFLRSLQKYLVKEQVCGKLNPPVCGLVRAFLNFTCYSICNCPLYFILNFKITQATAVFCCVYTCFIKGVKLLHVKLGLETNLS